MSSDPTAGGAARLPAPRKLAAAIAALLRNQEEEAETAGCPEDGSAELVAAVVAVLASRKRKGS